MQLKIVLFEYRHDIGISSLPSSLPLPYSAVVPRVHPVCGRAALLHPAEEVPRPQETEVLGAGGTQRRYGGRQGPAAEAASRQIGQVGRNNAENRCNEKVSVHLHKPIRNDNC